jgi:hypothetical protein
MLKIDRDRGLMWGVAAILVLATAGYFYYPRIIDALDFGPPRIRMVKPVWYSLTEPVGKTFEGFTPGSCVIVKVRAIKPATIFSAHDGYDAHLIEQPLLILDTLGHKLETNPAKENGQKDFGKLIPGDGQVILAKFDPSYAYPWKEERSNLLQLQKNGSFDVQDKNYRKVTLRVRGQGESPPLDQDSYACVATIHGKGEYESKAVHHRIYYFFEDVK